MSKSQKINVTTNYRMFTRSLENRPLNEKKHRKLEKSMKLYGFLKCYPIVCVRDAKGNLLVYDGQHRLAIASKLGLPVYWTESDEDFDIAVVNCTQKGWQLKDYAQKFANNGVQSYRKALEFSEAHGLPIGTAFALLAGTVSFGNIDEAFIKGAFKIKDQPYADAVASVFGPITKLAPVLRNARFLEACMYVARVPEFDTKRLIQGASQCREQLVSYSTRDAYLTMIESVYNFKRQKLVPLKILAISAMRKRNVVKKKDNKDSPDAAPAA